MKIRVRVRVRVKIRTRVSVRVRARVKSRVIKVGHGTQRVNVCPRGDNHLNLRNQSISKLYSFDQNYAPLIKIMLISQNYTHRLKLCSFVRNYTHIKLAFYLYVCSQVMNNICDVSLFLATSYEPSFRYIS